MKSAIYEGTVRHRRHSPVGHAFTYRLFMLYLDLDELPTLFARRWLWSNEGRAIARFRRRDHLKNQGPASQDLRESVRELVRERTGVRPTGPIRLLTHLEYFRYRFNPVSFYFCFDASGQQVEAIVAEINNTPWGEQHCYVLGRAESLSGSETQRFAFDKAFHISPFMGMDMRYDWRFTPPAETLAIHMENHRGAERLFDATMALRRAEITPFRLNALLVRFPFITVKVIIAIYWQALRLWMKRCPAYAHPRTVSTPEDVRAC